jgi:hypothetical protein
LQAYAAVAATLKLGDPRVADVLAALRGEVAKASHSWDIARAYTAVAPKLTDTQAKEALSVVEASLAWAAWRGEATESARALVALSARLTDQEATEELVKAVAYPAVAGPATDVLLDAVHARDSDIPAKEAGTEARLIRLAKKYPEVLRPPVCPPPPQPTAISGLECPSASD